MCDWKVQKIPDLVDKIYKTVQLQYADVKRALYEMGDYLGAPEYQSSRLTKQSRKLAF